MGAAFVQREGFGLHMGRMRKGGDALESPPHMTPRLSERLAPSDARSPPMLLGVRGRLHGVCGLVYSYVDTIKRVVCQRVNIVWNP